MSMYLCTSLFHVNHERREINMYVCQVLNGVSNGTQEMFMYLCVCARAMCMFLCPSLSIGVHIAPLGHDGPLPHQNYHCRPLSWLHFLTLDSCQILSGQLPLHLLQ